MKYSDEQRAIIESPNRRLILVQAYSGCGKSTCLIGYAAARPKEKMLYLSFNKSVAEEAKKKFPSNVTCKTMNGLAYQDFGKMFADRIGDKITGSMFTCILSGIEKNESRRIALAHHGLATFEAYCNSADYEPGMQHISSDALSAISMGLVDAEKIVSAAITILQEMLTGVDCPVSHSLYMKLYQLNTPDLPFDTILVDEAQDLNPVVLDILRKQSARIIMVGDPHQSIYAFRGSVNALEEGQDADYFWLTQTYRFGQNLADLATGVLQSFKNAEKPLKGFGRDVYINDVETMTQEMQEWRKTPFHIQRTKAGIVETLVNYCNQEDRKDAKIMLPGGSKSYGFNTLMDAYRLFSKGESVGVLAAYKSWDQYCEVNELTLCPDAANTIRIVSRYKGMIPRTLMELKKRETSSRKQASLIITTAHKSKGLEHPMVILGDDFQDINSLKADGITMSTQEINLMYVAMTRAEKAIHLSAPFKSLIRAAGLNI